MKTLRRLSVAPPKRWPHGSLAAHDTTPVKGGVYEKQTDFTITGYRAGLYPVEYQVAHAYFEIPQDIDDSVWQRCRRDG